MQLYFSPLSCSIATRISLYEAGVDATYVQVDTRARKTHDGRDFDEINPLGLVPVLELDDGRRITENAAILQYVGEHFPQAGLVPTDPFERTRLRQWLSFIGTELHKPLYVPLLDKHAPAEVKAYARAKADSRLAVLERHLGGHEFLLDRPSVADAYLYIVLTWSFVTGIDLTKWPTVAAYRARLHERPAFARAFAEEQQLYAAEQARAGRQAL